MRTLVQGGTVRPNILASLMAVWPTASALSRPLGKSPARTCRHVRVGGGCVRWVCCGEGLGDGGCVVGVRNGREEVERFTRNVCWATGEESGARRWVVVVW